MNKIYSIFRIIVFSILSFCSVHYSYGVVYFNDNFSNSLEKWNFVPGTVSNLDSWAISNGVLIGTVNYGGSSYLYPITTPRVLSDFVLQSSVMNVSGVDVNIFFRQSEDKEHYYAVGYRFNSPGWPGVNNIVLYKYDHGYSLLKSYSPLLNNNLTQNIWHKIKIDVSGQLINIYFDDNLAISYVDDGVVFDAGLIALQNWGGTFTSKIINKFDDFAISDGSISQNKIIFLPGFGGSWNEKAMVLNQIVPQSEWRMTPFAKGVL